MKKLLIFIFLFSIVLCFAQMGKIAGKISVKDSGNALQGASVFLEDSKTGTYTKANGTYILQNVPVGEHTVYVSFMGYERTSQTVLVENDMTAVTNFELVRSAVQIEGISISANRAIKRETPIAFTDVSEETIQDRYNTQDIPQLLDDVPGLFANTTGIGDAEITMRGFEADKIQVLINGIPVNDPESQRVYWSNWTGLSSSVKSVQVQKGAGSSLYGSGAFGGSLNIETMGSTPEQEITVRSSYGTYYTDGDVADGKGAITEYNPYNYNVIVRYNSGNLFGGKFNYNIMLERKRGDYYLTGTNYDGYSFGLEAQNIIGTHTINTSFIGAPQNHNQVYFKSDRDLMKTLGRNYNRNNHSYQENYYFKPQFSIRDEWKISDNQLLMTNLFFTTGNGGGKYINQDKFDINTGAIYYRDDFLDATDPAAYEWDEFAHHALYLYQQYDLIVEGFNPNDSIYIPALNIWIPAVTYLNENGDPQSVSGNGADFYRSRYDYSWRNNSVSDHKQFGMNTYYQQQIHPMVDMVLGGEFRRWEADHYRKRENFRHLGDLIGYDVNPTTGDSTAVYDVEVYDEVDRQYDETAFVTNMSAFARFSVKPIDQLNIMIDGQLARYNSEVKENPLEIYDLGIGEPTGYFYYATKNTPLTDPDTGQIIVDTSGVAVKKFSTDDYKKTYEFFSPKFGVNYNVTDYLNIMANYSISYKEPKTMEWYSSYDGPDGNQRYYLDLVAQDSLGQYYEYIEEHFYGELKPEKINTIEFGIGYEGVNWSVDANYYISDYTDKIESVTIPVTNYNYNAQTDSVEVFARDEGLTLNAGQARHQGLELSSKMKWKNIDASGSLTLSNNRWTEMNVEQIFGGNAEDMVGKVVPYSPETIINGSIGYTIDNMPLEGKLRIGFTGKFWDDYYANYENEYVANYIWNGSEYLPEQEYYQTQTLSGDYIMESPYNYVYVGDGLGDFSLRDKMISSKLPAFLEFGSNIKYSFKIGKTNASLRFDFANILNKDDNYLSARVASDYNRGYFDDDGEFVEDKLNSNRYMYVTPSPLFTMFVTMEVKF